MQMFRYLLGAVLAGLISLAMLTGIMKANGADSAEPQAMTALEIVDLGTLDGDNASFATDLNDQGHVVGYSRHITDVIPPPPPQAFLWRNGSLMGLTTPDESGSSAEAINASGHIVGQIDTIGGDATPTLWIDNEIYRLPVMTDTLSTIVVDINTAGIAAGYAISDTESYLLLWDADQVMTDTVPMAADSSVAALNDAGVVVGQQERHAFRWTEKDGFQDLGTLGGATSRASAVNSAGIIVGSSDLKGNLSESLFMWRSGTMTDLGVPELGAGEVLEGIDAHDINDENQIVGQYTVNGQKRAFLWQDDSFTDLTTLLPEGSGWGRLVSAEAINARGWIVGTGLKDGRGRAFLLKLPEPIYQAYLPVTIGLVDLEAPIDIAPYLTGSGTLYEVRHSQGSQARHQTQFVGDRYYHTKGNEVSAEWEELWNSAENVYRGTDTSPGGGNYYTLFDKEGEVGSKWAPRYWRVGEIYERNPYVVFYNKSNCNVVASGYQRSWLKFVALHDSFTFDTGVTVNDVIQLAWLLSPDGEPEENYFYSAEFGLVGWGSRDRGYSAISEIHGPGDRPDNNRETIKCLSQLDSLDELAEEVELNQGPLPPGYRAK